MDREYVLVGRSGETRVIAADQLDQVELQERDRVLGFPVGMEAPDRERLVKAATKRFYFETPFKKAGVELHVAVLGSWRMICAKIVSSVVIFMALHGTFLAASLGVCSVFLVHEFAPNIPTTERVLLTPEKAYFSFVAKTKISEKPEVDIEATKKDMEEYKKWREGVRGQ
jgi:hypothetical protein